MANTPFLDLVKPAGTDRALVSVINSNSDKIDTGVSTLSEQIGNMVAQAYGDWKSAAVGYTKAFRYEGQSTTDYDIPNGYVIVTVTKQSTARGVAIAQRWNGNQIWINRLHDTWQGWVELAQNPYIPSSVQNNYNTVFSDMGDVTGYRYDIMNSGASNAPASIYGVCYTVKRYTNETTTLGIQMAMLVNNEVYKRTYNNGTWSAWQQLALKSDLPMAITASVQASASGTFGPPSPYNNANNYTFINAYANDNNLYDIRVRIDNGYYYCAAYQTNGSAVTSTTINVTFVFSKKN